MAEKRHTSAHYDQELREVKEGLLYLGALTEKAIERAIKALTDRDAALAHNVICDDSTIDRLDVELEEKCIRMLALRQPTARDLRFITTAIKINGHLERIGDMAAKIAQKSIILSEEPPMKPYIDIPRMAEIAREMIRKSLDALVKEDAELAHMVRAEDETIDNLNEQVFRELLTFMMENPKTVHRALIIMQISKSLERISDHAVGIADMVLYMVTGKIVRHEPTCPA
ncbi:MAG TPA: phosphate signaling complex protein PhoU [Syntrophales bacterium]|nr:phosphate signaling complex protein PhoU [Syntrophales bacterium]